MSWQQRRDAARNELRDQIEAAVREEADLLFRTHFPTMQRDGAARICRDVERRVLRYIDDAQRDYIAGEDYDTIKGVLERYAREDGYEWREARRPTPPPQQPAAQRQRYVDSEDEDSDEAMPDMSNISRAPVQPLPAVGNANGLSAAAAASPAAPPSSSMPPAAEGSFSLPAGAGVVRRGLARRLEEGARRADAGLPRRERGALLPLHPAGPGDAVLL